MTNSIPPEKKSKPFKIKLFKVSDVYFQAKISKNMLFEAEVNDDGTVNCNVINTDYKKPNVKLGKRISLGEAYNFSTTKFNSINSKWVETFVKGISQLQVDMVRESPYVKKRVKKNHK
jgi:hypothetical protein